MAEFLTTRGTTSEIENIINNADNDLVLISPFIKIPDSLFQNLRAADHKGVKIKLVYGKKTLEPGVIEQLSQLKNLKLYFLDNLHAKCYFNEQSMVITSLNLYDFSEQNNREMGVLITLQNDKGVFTKAIREARMIIDLATLSDVNVQVKEQTQKQFKPQSTVEKQKPKSNWLKDLSAFLPGLFDDDNGYCIGCKTEIEYNLKYPYCPKCYKARAKNIAQKATYCHRCGHPSTTSFSKPLCRSCFENY
jgi:phosphatidylserine/phosphatidylglycerophosphate/cardiolipin synthase-like enzyme